MADDKTQKPMTTLGMSMRRFGRNLMRHYERLMSEPRDFDRQLKPYQTMSTSPLNWDNIVTLKQNNREAPLLDEPIQDDISEQFVPPPQPRRQVPPPQQPIQRQPAPQKKKGLDPRLQAILNFHNQRDSQREIQRKERRTKWQEAHEQGDNQQSSPDIPGWKPKPRASFDYIETSALIKDKAEKPEPKPEKIQREADENKPSSRSKVVEEKDFSQPEMEEGYIAANEPSWDDFDDDFEEAQEIELIESPYTDLNNDFQETEHITPIDEPFADTETSNNIRMPAPKQSDRAGDTSSKPSPLQRQADDDEDLSDTQASNSAPAHYTDTRDEDAEQSFESPTNQTPDTSQGHFERRKPNPQPPTRNQQNKTVQRKPEIKPKASPRQNEFSDADSADDTHESDEDLSEPSPNFAVDNIVQRQADEIWDANDEYVSQSSIDKPVKNVPDKARPDAQQSPIQRQEDDNWDDGFDTQIDDSTDDTQHQIQNQADENYSQLENASKTAEDSSRPIQRQTDKQIRRKYSDSSEQDVQSRPVTSADTSPEKPANIQRKTEIDGEQDETFADDYTPSAQTTDNHSHDAPHTIQRQSESDDSNYEDYSLAKDTVEKSPRNTSYPVQRQADDNWQVDEHFSDENDYPQVNTAEHFPDSVQRRADDNWGDNANDGQVENSQYDTVDKSTRDTSYPIQRQADEHFSDDKDYPQSSNQTINPPNKENLSSNDAHIQPVDTPDNAPHSIQRQTDNDLEENDTFAPPSDDITHSSDNPPIDSQHSVQRQENNHNADNNSSDEGNYSQAVDAPSETYDDTSQTIQRQPDINNDWHNNSNTSLIDASDNATPNTAQRQIDANWYDDSDFSADAPYNDTPQSPIQRRQVSQKDESPRPSRSDKPAQRIQREADTSARHDDANNSDFVEDAQNYSFPAMDNIEADSPIVQRSMGADGEMVYNVVEANDTPIARQTDPTSNLHQALIDAGIVPADSPSPETSEQASSDNEHSVPPAHSNVPESPVQRTIDEHSTNAPPNKAEQVNPANSKSSEIVQRQMGADGEMYYNKAQEDHTLPEQSVDVFQGLMQAGMISPEDNPAFNTNVHSADNTDIQRTEDESQSDIGISRDIQNAMLQRLRDKNKDIIQQKELARDTHENIQRTSEPIQPTYTASVQRTPPIDMLMREEFIDDDNSVDDVEKLTRDVYRLLSNRLRDEAERRNRK